MQKLKIGVFGVGHLGAIHLKCLGNLPEHYSITGFFDPDETAASRAVENYNVKAYSNPTELIEECDAIDIVAPTSHHFELIKQGLEAGLHVFTEKPATENSQQAETLLRLARQKGRLVQVGHVERYNPAYTAIQDLKLNPMFIEGHRLAQFNPRGTDVSVIHDLMIHDIDILVSLIPDEVESIRANGVGVISSSPDICNARIEFANGAVANLTASRISLKSMRKLRMFQSDAYISVDFLERKSEIIQLQDTPPEDGTDAFEVELEGKSKWILASFPDVVEHNAIEEELKSFHNAIVESREPDVSLKDALKGMLIAEGILNAVEAGNAKAKI